jgi:hypothetical protein
MVPKQAGPTDNDDNGNGNGTPGANSRETVCYRCCCLPPSSKLCPTPKPKIPSPQNPQTRSRRRSAARPTISRQPLYTSTKTLSEHGGHDGCGGRRAEKKHVDTSLPNRWSAPVAGLAAHRRIRPPPIHIHPSLERGPPALLTRSLSPHPHATKRSQQTAPAPAPASAATAACSTRRAYGPTPTLLLLPGQRLPAPGCPLIPAQLCLPRPTTPVRQYLRPIRASSTA